jgi:hypothetical protein
MSRRHVPAMLDEGRRESIDEYGVYLINKLVTPRASSGSWTRAAL